MTTIVERALLYSVRAEGSGFLLIRARRPQRTLLSGVSFQSRGSGLGNSPTRWPAYQRSPVRRSRSPFSPDLTSKPLQRRHTGSITRRQTPPV
jgi:hypothetical protein